MITKHELEKRANRIFERPMTNRDFLEATFLTLAAGVMYWRNKSPEEISELVLQRLDHLAFCMALNAPSDELGRRWLDRVEDVETMKAVYNKARAAVARGETKIRLDN